MPDCIFRVVSIAFLPSVLASCGPAPVEDASRFEGHNIVDYRCPLSISIGETKQQLAASVEDAWAIAKPRLEGIYGRYAIWKQSPFYAADLNGSIYFQGRMPKGMNLGGVAETAVCKGNGAILFVTHGK